ncbi:MULTISPECIES: hypothetical protein [Paraburkholderia]|uniref:Uncharacterized membrane-anchored protein YhcB (DUF1043 family) n=2 Tax=Paraburkholderia TaxID=1822464 RepID=A0A7Z0BAZ8_9BURK|nr:hypothetical protein [Paraburkholderia bryophila]NYH26375.1 uncharacterized membrane-anchored protein YhcB (DUF1043 family) [Paraburkholderia bryophila]
MADSVASTQSRLSRAASKKRRQATVSTETENKLARAARSAQRLAQLSDAARDGSTLDLFPDDPTRATLEAMNIDVRQGTLHGFELPDVVLAAVGVIDAGDGALPDARSVRRAPRAAKADEPTPVNAVLSGLDMEPWDAAGSSAAELAFGDVTPKERTAAGDKLATSTSTSARDAATPLTPAMAAATVARSVTALRQASAMGATSTDDSAMASTSGGVKTPPRFAATFAKATTASRDVGRAAGVVADVNARAASAAGNAPAGAASDASMRASDGVAADANTGAVAGTDIGATADANTGKATDTNATATIGASEPNEPNEPNQPNEPNASSDRLTPQSVAASAGPKPGVNPSLTAAGSANAAFAEPWREARRAEAAAAALRAAPELDRARATAFADTVDALYGVIADQRRAASDHSRRMKWLLPIVVGALLVTVAIGITQTVLLMRLTRETTAQQHRIEQLMQNQQAAMTSLLDTHMAMAAAAAANANAAAAAASTTPQQVAATPAHSKRAARAQHAHKPKASNSR